MPIEPSIQTSRISQEDFKEIAFAAMQHVFAIHAEFGRFFDEKIYKLEFASRMKDVLLEVAVDVIHGTFTKRYFADAIAGSAALFEFKTVETLHPKHTAQAIHYLQLLDLPHGKIINVRPERVQHKFVNCNKRLVTSRDPSVTDQEWNRGTPGADQFRDTLMALIHDWGTGLELPLYEEALTHLLGGEAAVNTDVRVYGERSHLTDQRMRLVAPNVAFKLTALPGASPSFVVHARRLLKHTSLEAIHWANITQKNVTFATIR